MTKRFLMFMVAGLLVAVSGSAFADQVSYVTSTPIPSTSTNWTDTLAFQQFNSSLGTLTSVKLDLSGSMSTVITVESQAGATGDASTQVKLSVTGGGLSLPDPVINMMSPAFLFTNLNGTVVSNPLPQTGSFSDTYTDSGVLGTFTGLGSVILNAGTFTKTWVSFTSGNADVSQVTEACLTGTVTYTYDPVPEPMTVGLLSLGGLLIARKRKHS